MIAEMDNASSVKATCESPVDIYNVSYSPSDTEVNNPLRSPISSKSPKHWPTKSGSSSSAGPTPEKQEMDFVLLSLFDYSSAKKSDGVWNRRIKTSTC